MRMKLEKIRINFDSNIGWTCAISISNGKGESRGTGLDEVSWKKARWNAVRHAVKKFNKEIGRYKGGVESDIMETTSLLLSEITNLKGSD